MAASMHSRSFEGPWLQVPGMKEEMVTRPQALCTVWNVSRKKKRKKSWSASLSDATRVCSCSSLQLWTSEPLGCQSGRVADIRSSPMGLDNPCSGLQASVCNVTTEFQWCGAHTGHRGKNRSFGELNLLSLKKSELLFLVFPHHEKMRFVMSYSGIILFQIPPLKNTNSESSHTILFHSNQQASIVYLVHRKFLRFAFQGVACEYQTAT